MRALLRRLEAAVASALDRWVLRHHAPLGVETGVLVCVVCRVGGRRKRPAKWPCKPYVEAADRLRERT